MNGVKPRVEVRSGFQLAIGVHRGKEKRPLDDHLLPGLEDPLGRDLHVVVFLQGDLDQLLELVVLEDLKPLQVSEGSFGRLRGDIRPLAPEIVRHRIGGPLVVRADGAAANQPEGQKDGQGGPHDFSP